jgi:hypothetical protein
MKDSWLTERGDFRATKEAMIEQSHSLKYLHNGINSFSRRKGRFEHPCIFFIYQNSPHSFGLDLCKEAKVQDVNPSLTSSQTRDRTYRLRY